MPDEILQLFPQMSIFPQDFLRIGLDEYQNAASLTDKNPRPSTEGVGFALLGLFGETGSLLSELKKKQRDQDSYVAYHDSVMEELGDVLWYFANVALRANLELSTIARRVTASLTDWDYHGVADTHTFADLQQLKTVFTGPLSTSEVEHQLLLLAGKVGMLVNDFSTGRIDLNRDLLSAGLVEIFRVLIVAADQADVSLNEAAVLNLRKVLSRWPTNVQYDLLFDDDCDEDERLPRKIVMRFVEKDLYGKKYVIQKCSGINIGDRLTDNKLEPDDYRFHDVFHLAYAAILGWSPVLRALFRVKRKSKPEVDENQDGARAILIEEGIATWIFNHGVRNQNFRNVKALDYSLLKAVKELVRGYEVESRPMWQWERAILEGFSVFRELQRERGGIVTADLLRHSIGFESSR